VGWVRRAHGLKGEVEVHLDWADSPSLLGARSVVLSHDGAERSAPVQSARQTPKGVLLRLEGVADRDAAEALRGFVVGVLRGELPELEDDEYYLGDLVGGEVIGPEGCVGKVVDLQIYPSVDALVIELPSGERAEQPVLDEWVESVDVVARRVVLRSTDGLIEMPGRRAPNPGST
jgi:16S rRNA processing protein RimM